MTLNPGNQDHEDVQLELHDIAKERKAYKQVVWVLWPLYFLGNAILLTMIVIISCWIFDGSNLVIVAVITCTAYACAFFGMAAEWLTRRVSRMEMHGLTVQNEVMLVKELIQDEQQRSVQWRQV